MLSMKHYINEQLEEIHVSKELEHRILNRTVYSSAVAREHTAGQAKPRRVSRRFVALVAAACLVFAFSITAYATGFFGLNDMVALSEQLTDPLTGERSRADIIAMQGYPESPEYKACAEWQSFLASYDTDGSLLAAATETFGERYSSYLCYTQEMADELDRIMAKFDLVPQTGLETISRPLDCGLSGFIGGMDVPVVGYRYAEGSFMFTAEFAPVENGLAAPYEFCYYKRGVFSGVFLNVGSADGYNSWQYTTASGQNVLLSLSANKGLVMTETPGGFVCINVLAGTETPFLPGNAVITAESLESFAELFDYAAL